MTSKKAPIHQITDPISGFHAVVVGPMRVMLVRDGDGWFAHSLEVDYFAEGDTPEKAKSAFVGGLCSTIDEHLRIYGDITRLAVPAPPHIWAEFVQLANGRKFAPVHEDKSVNIPTLGLPYDGLGFFQQAVA